MGKKQLYKEIAELKQMIVNMNMNHSQIQPSTSTAKETFPSIQNIVPRENVHDSQNFYEYRDEVIARTGEPPILQVGNMWCYLDDIE